eukprot:TRINITY_DN6461_c2_g2_i1.p1 TRINITY_DN6461_c2_g2~~TRINITY_DN6461_c2_g2_i1.p1  ORF type:complete len:279 (+),score=71.55 TRINITY_DN6461_c2_g2_i1:74-910(+)
MSKWLCLLAIATAIVAQDAPADIEEPHVVVEFCSADSDCLAGNPDPHPSEVTCSQGKCNCLGPYELFKEAMCKLPEDPEPTVRVVVELTWDDVACDDIPANFEETVRQEMLELYGTADIEINLKCGSVVVLVVAEGVLVTVASTLNINEALKSGAVVAAIGPMSKVDTYSGSGSCVLSTGQAIVLSVGGLCQPIQCQAGYTLNAGKNVNELDVCERVHVSESDDEIGGGTIAAIVVGVLGFIAVVVLLIFAFCRKTDESQQLVDDEQDHNNKNGPDYD